MSASRSAPSPNKSIEPESYVVPLVHTRVPPRLVETGFWGGLTGAALVGVIDPPIALLLGAGVILARHRRS